MTTVILKEDSVDAFIWSTILTELDANDEVLSRDITFDNGTTQAESFEDGVLRQSVRLDPATEGNTTGIMPWVRIEQNYDSQGRITSRIKVEDDGTAMAVSTEYKYGAISRIVKEDLGADGGPSDAKPWANIATYYDDDGSVWAKTVTLDSGLQTNKHYTDGILTYATKYDFDENGEASDAHAWHKIDFWYDTAGVIAARVEYRDDSLVKHHSYEDGALRFIALIDKTGVPGEASGVKDWHVKQTTFDAFGNVRLKSTSYDNNDETTLVFEDGLRVKKWEVDGNNSEDWVRRETIYDADGQVIEVNTYEEWPVATASFDFEYF